ncbi:membrane protein of unknown function [Methylacidimicrobium sp. AP8]|nr:membrane protein of unknown function [Methylacidimicrobium sp. AP8]
MEWGGSHINIPIAVLIWLMIFPMMLKIDFGGLRGVARRPKGLAITLFVNWLVKPFSMALIGSLLVVGLFSSAFHWIDPATAHNYLAGLIILAAAPCTAMVFVWSYLVEGDAAYTLAQVAVNDLIMTFAFAPIVMLLVGVSGIVVPKEVLLTSVVAFIVIPLAAGWVTRSLVIRLKGLAAISHKLSPTACKTGSSASLGLVFHPRSMSSYSSGGKPAPASHPSPFAAPRLRNL